MQIERPDLSQIDPAVRAYIEALESELERSRDQVGETALTRVVEPTEPPTTINVVTVSARGMVKRTPRHLYGRQRRGGMGVFDLETREDDPPAFLTLADQSQELLLITDQARAFRLPLAKLPESEVHMRGIDLTTIIPLPANEDLAVVLPAQDAGYLALVTQRGYVRSLRFNYVGVNLRPGTPLYDVKHLGAPTAGCWSSGDGDLFITTRQGRAIRFGEKRVHPSGSLGIRLERDDDITAITAVKEDSGVFLLGADGKGTVRMMSGFLANKAPGAGGKTAMKTDRLVASSTVAAGDEIFIISRLSKIIRFPAREVPPKEGVVQGVNCMDLRADETVAMAVSPA